jgi:hypothetical protein
MVKGDHRDFIQVFANHAGTFRGIQSALIILYIQ